MAKKHERPPRQETEEERELKAIAEHQARERAEDAIAPAGPETAMSIALTKAREKNGSWKPERSADEAAQDAQALERWENEGGQAKHISERSDAAATAEGKSLAIPAELKEIYGDTVPPASVLKMYAKLGGRKKQSYLEHVAKTHASELEKRKRREGGDRKHSSQSGTERKTQEEEKPFDPHSVPSALSIKEQQRAQEMREHLAKKGVIPPESVREADVDIDGARAPQYETRAGMQADMDTLSREVPAKVRKIEAKAQREVDRGIDEYESQHKLLETGFKKAFPKLDMADAGQSKAYQELTLLRQALTKEFNAHSPERTGKQVEDFLTKLGVDVGELRAQKEDIKQVQNASAEQGTQPTAESAPEIPITLTPEDVPEYIKEQFGAEGTPKEWRSKLNNLIRNAQGKLYGTKEKIEWWKSSEEHLVRHSAELDVEAEKMGWIGNTLRTFGEWYNKRDWKTKLAVGLALGVGYGVALSAASLPAAVACIGLIGAQRTAGLMTMYLKYEKNVRSGDTWGKEKAFGKALAYTAAMTAAMLGLTYAVKELSETETAKDTVQHVREWLAGKLGHPAAPEAVQPAIVAGATPGPEMPPLTVHAAPGKGYEYMLQKMWEQLQGQHLDPSKFAEGSDIRRLLEASQADIGKVAHQIASDPNHAFYNPDGSSVVVQANDIIAFNTGGQIQLMTPEGVAGVHAAVGAHVTPAYVPEASMPVSVPEVAVPGYVPETPGAAGPAPLAEQTIPAREPVQTVDLTPGQEPAAPEAPPAPERILLRDSEGNPVTDSSGNPVETRFFEPSANPDVVVNQFGLAVPLNEPHVYGGADGKHMFVFGGTQESQWKVMQEYLTAHPDQVVIGTNESGTYRVPWGLVNGQAQPIGTPERTSGIFSFFSSFMKAPGPDELQKLIK